MSTVATRPSSGSSERPALPWKTRVEEPLNRFVHYPIARQMVRALVRTPITANQVTMVQPLIALVAAYLISFEDRTYLAAGVAVFMVRSLLDCVDGTLARAKKTASSNGHAIDAFCDWLSVVFLYGGIYAHLMLHPPTDRVLGAYVPVTLVVAVSLAQGAVRSAAADYYLRKFGSIFETGQDRTVEDLRRKQLALTPGSGFFARFEVWSARSQHFWLQGESFDPERSRALPFDDVVALRSAEQAPLTRFIAGLWSVSNGDFFITLTLVSLLLDRVWEAQLFFATAGVAWIVGVIALSRWFLRHTARRLQTARA